MAAARHRELLALVAEEHERLLKELEELKSSTGRTADRLPTPDSRSLRPVPEPGPPFSADDVASSGGDRSDRSHGLSSYCHSAQSYPHLQEAKTLTICESMEQLDDSSLALWPQWASPADDESMPDSSASSSGASGLQLFASTVYQSVREIGRLPDIKPKSSCLSSFVMRPTSARRQFWDILSVVILGYDIVMLPLFAFGEEMGGFIQYVDYCTTAVWTIDIFMSFLTGYYTVGIVETRLRKIALRYLKSWFFLDFMVVALDWLTTLLFQQLMARFVGLIRVIKVFKIVRFLRMLRLMRLLKFRGSVGTIGSYLRSESMLTCFAIFRSLGYILASSHYIACAWYFISGRDRPNTWVQPLDDEGRDTSYRYVTSLHWAIAQFTPASAEVQPRNVEERIFAVIVILSGMVGFSCFVSSITQAMAKLHHVHIADSEQRALMRRFFIENHISFDVGNRIMRFIKERKVSEKTRTYESSVANLSILPEQLRRELHKEMYRPVAGSHYFLHHALHTSDGFAEEVCHEAMAEFSVKRTEELFAPGHRAQVFHIRSGVGVYHVRNEIEAQPTTLSGKWLVEAVLWVQWQLRGRLVAATLLETVSLDADAFRRAVGTKAVPLLVCANYAKQYRRHLAAADDRDTLAELGFEHEIVQQMASLTFSSGRAMRKGRSFAFRRSFSISTRRTNSDLSSGANSQW